MRYPIWGLVITIFLNACTEKDACIPSEDISSIQFELTIDRLDQKLNSISNKEELGLLLKNNPVFSEVFLSSSQYPDKSIFIDNTFQLLSNPHIDTLYQEIELIFGDLEDIRLQYEEAFKRILFYYPDFNPPRVQTVISGLANDMYISDSLVIIGIDYYLGAGAKFRPINTPEYILERYRKENIVPNTMLLLSSYFNKDELRETTLLADMIFYGKAYYFSKQMLPCVPDSIFLGYTSEEMKDINYNQPVIWANLIQNEALFDTNHFIKEKFIGERPKTYEISQDCPGRIGRWLGWQIVNSFMKNHEEYTVIELMQIDNANSLFEQSKFKPKSKND